MSDDTAHAIDEEIKAVVERNYQRAEKMIKDNLDILHAMKDALIKYETIDALQIDDLMARTTVRDPSDWDNSGSGSSSDSSSTGGTSTHKEQASDIETDDKTTSEINPDLSDPNDSPAK
jgi:cell division protease FtsH